MKQLKFFASIVLVSFSFASAQAQFDLKINPLGLLFSNFTVAGEIGLNQEKNLGLEVTAGVGFNKFTVTVDDVEDEYRTSTFRTGANVRYYFNPDKGLDKFYTGLYGRYAGGKWSAEDSNEELTSNRFALGFLFGTKIVSGNERFVFDFGIGFGRALVYKVEGDGEVVNLDDIPLLNWDIPAYISLGYRF